MERIITIVALVLSVAGLGYLKSEQLDRRAEAEAEAAAQAEAAATEAALSAAEAAKFHFTVPHDHRADTQDLQIFMNSFESGDADTDSISYRWEQVDGASVELESSDGQLTSFAAPPGEYTFQLTVTDSYGEQATEEATVAIQPEPNTRPAASIEIFAED
tara:strand:+ start:978 stop:1457 length:480 start_codon:yes stop_codon:yes gene_type:complete